MILVLSGWICITNSNHYLYVFNLINPVTIILIYRETPGSALHIQYTEVITILMCMISFVLHSVLDQIKYRTVHRNIHCMLLKVQEYFGLCTNACNVLHYAVTLLVIIHTKIALFGFT